MAATERKNNPNATSLAYDRQKPSLDYVRDVYAGTSVLRQKNKQYLPQFPKEEDPSYAARLASAVLFNCLKTTISGLTGMVFRKDVKLADTVPAAIRADAENIDLTGRALPVFAKDVFRAQLLDGHTFIFVDYQAVDTNVIARLADERKAELRPYWIHLTKSDVLRLRTINVHGRPLLVELAYRVNSVEPDGSYGEKLVERVRIYRLVAAPEPAAGLRVEYEVHRRVSDSTSEDKWELETPPTAMSIDRIPLVVIYSNRTAAFESEPPFLDLAYENVLHYQTRSDRTNSMHITGVPIPVTIGLVLDDSGKLPVGSDVGFNLPIGGDAKYLEPLGNSLPEMRQELQDIEQRMAALGLAALQRQSRAAETAEARRIDKAATDSQLAESARALKAGLEEGAVFHAKWRKLTVEPTGTVTVNTDFEADLLDAGMVKELRESVAASQLSLETMWARLVRGGVLDDEFDPIEERRRIQEDLMERGAGVEELDPDQKPVGGAADVVEEEEEELELVGAGA